MNNNERYIHGRRVKIGLIKAKILTRPKSWGMRKHYEDKIAIYEKQIAATIEFEKNKS